MRVNSELEIEEVGFGGGFGFFGVGDHFLDPADALLEGLVVFVLDVVGLGVHVEEAVGEELVLDHFHVRFVGGEPLGEFEAFVAEGVDVGEHDAGLGELGQDGVGGGHGREEGGGSS